MVKRYVFQMLMEDIMQYVMFATHMGGPLAEGKLEEYIVQCPGMVLDLILEVVK